MSLSKEQFIKNSVWTFLELTLYPLLMIVATPVFINKLGIEQYGLWMLVSTITLGINVLNIGVGDTNIRLISRYRGENNIELIRKVFNYNFSLSLFLFMIALLVGVLFSRFDFISLFYKSDNYHFANTILLMACCAAGLKFVEISILSVFKAFERFDINSKLVILSKNSIMIANLVLVLSGHDLITIFFFSICISIVNIILQLLVLHNFWRGIIAIPRFSFFTEKLDFVNYNFWYWLQSVVGLMGFLADKLAVAYFTDVRTLGYYSVASLVGTQIHNFFMAFGSFIFPRVSFKLAENKDVARIYFIARSFVALPAWALIGFLLLFGDFIFKLWLGQETYIQSILFIKLYLVFETALILIIVPFHFINGTKLIQLNSLFEVVIRSTHFISILIGYYIAGVEGIILGLIASTCLNIPFQYFYFHSKVIGSVDGMQFLWVIVPVLFMAGLLIFTSVFLQASLVIAVLVCCKWIYFDPARQYSKETILFSGLFSRPESK